MPTQPGELQALSERLLALSIEKACLGDASFHAWRGAVLMALGRPVEAVEPLERALMVNPDLPGAQLDLAQALALQGDRASAIAMLEALRGRADVAGPIRTAIDSQLTAIASAAQAQDLASGGWHGRWRLASLAGGDSNLNNAPAASEITLTIEQQQYTLPLDASSRPKRGGAVLASAQWQGLRINRESLWVVQGEVRARQTADRATSYQQADVAAAWLQAPAAPRQWVARVAGSYLQFGGASLLQAYRASLLRQLAPIAREQSTGMLDPVAGCRPAFGVEFERRRYPSSPAISGLYSGALAGVSCRPAASGDQPGAPSSFVNMELRLGADRPFDEARAGGTYRRSEVRVQWERPLFERGQAGVMWSSTRQSDSAVYNVQLGNFPRQTLRHALQLDASWPLRDGLSLVGTAEATWQRSNIEAFVSRQRSLYVGLRWEMM
ncbi:tetratricopeptide repeat protein [Caenimonas aquaedulcis]|uniref:Tetratricopeptide repeat protein n=1 Tax=Caenimonas aquaedulcis TaxID=2793270 RepID=A0A931H7B6_9BURK|nr:tetratricopeptide repeat protein [Caenimonas aquaedulcis]MBG9389787.1 tetratricopeptide repeat protein [Caenimonas aquaedulcis]